MEYILTVRNTGFETGFRSFFRDAKIFENFLFELGDFFVCNRDYAEYHDDYLQIIPFVIITSDDRYFTYQRSTQSNEKRLHLQRSLGVGGHVKINKKTTLYQCAHLKWSDEFVMSVILRSLIRELREEVGFDIYQHVLFLPELSPLGVLYLNNNPVDKVHLGLVFELKIEPQVKFEYGEEISDPLWMTKETLNERVEEFESWSQYLIKNVLEVG